jgi:hypothetical protein
MQKMIEVKLQDLPVVHGLYCLLHDICEMKGEKMIMNLRLMLLMMKWFLKLV